MSSRIDNPAFFYRGYGYDPIGNRVTTEDGSTAVQSTDDRNELNQYTRVFRAGDPNAAVRPTYDARQSGERRQRGDSCFVYECSLLFSPASVCSSVGCWPTMFFRSDNRGGGPCSMNAA